MSQTLESRKVNFKTKQKQISLHRHFNKGERVDMSAYDRQQE